MKKDINNKEKEDRKLDLKLEVENFGPISTGKVELKPLTIFIGPNNAGKSYLALLVHSLFESLISLSSMDFNHPSPYKFVGASFLGKEMKYNEIFNKIKKMKIGEIKDIPEELIDKIKESFINVLFKEGLRDILYKLFGATTRELVSFNQKSFDFKLSSELIQIKLKNKGNELHLYEYPTLSKNIQVQIVKDNRYFINIEHNEKQYIIKINSSYIREVEEIDIGDMLLSEFIEIIYKGFLLDIAIKCFYLPASRTGLIKYYKEISANVMKNMPKYSSKNGELPQFSGSDSDFIASLISLPEKTGSLYEFAQNLEQKLLKGEIAVLRRVETGFPKIVYIQDGHEIPLHRASSTVTEIAPLIIYLKYYIEPGNILIIEEPEAHLHPANQRILAKYLVRLIRKGVNVLITTHSDYLISQFNSFIMLDQIDEKQRSKRYRYRKDDYLKIDEVSANVFKRDRKNGGFKVVKVKIDKEDGISDEEFHRINSSLYEEQYKLFNEIEKKEI